MHEQCTYYINNTPKMLCKNVNVSCYRFVKEEIPNVCSDFRSKWRNDSLENIKIPYKKLD